MSRSATVRPRTAAILLASAGATLSLAPTTHAGPTTTRWAAPVSGGFFDPANWVGGVLPSLDTPALINASGSPFVVSLITNRASLGIPITLDSTDATLRYATQSTNFTLPTAFGAIDVLRGTLTLAARTEMRSLDSVTVGTEGRIHFEGSLTQPLHQRRVRFGRDLTLDGAATFDGRAALIMYEEVLFSGFPTPRISINATGTADFAGGNVLAGGVITNNGVMRFLNDPAFNEDDSSFELSGSRIGFKDDNDRGFPTTFQNNGMVMVDRGDLILGAFGSHAGEFQLASGSRLLLEEAQHFLTSSRITGDGLVVAEVANLVSGAVRIEGDLLLERGGVVAASLAIGGDIELHDRSNTPTLDISGPVDVGGALVASNAALSFRSGFEGAIRSGPDIGYARTAEFFGAAHIRGNLFTQDGATFHHLARIDGDVARALFKSTATVQGNATSASFMQAAFIGGHASGVHLADGGTINGNLSGPVTIHGTTTVGGDFTQAINTRSSLTPGGYPDRLIVQGDVDIRSVYFESSMAIVAGGDFKTFAGLFSSVTADTVTFGGLTATGVGTVNLYPFSSITSTSARTLIERTRISVHQDYSGATGTIWFHNGFTVVYNPITITTRSGLNARINLETDRNDLFVFLADSLLAGTLDIGVIGNLSLLSFGDSFTILEGRVPSGSTDPLPTITGEFDRLFLPSLPGDLYFDVVYEPSAVRLVVIPTPGAGIGLVLGVAGLAAYRRRWPLAES